MARGIAFALGDGVGSLIKGFCAANPLPPIPLSVSPVDVIDGDLTFIDLLNAIIKTKATDPGVLKQFRDFFGANLMGAPVIENNFGVPSVNILAINKIPDRFWKGFNHYDYPDKIHTKVTYFLKLNEGTGWPAADQMLDGPLAGVVLWHRKQGDLIGGFRFIQADERSCLDHVQILLSAPRSIHFLQPMSR